MSDPALHFRRLENMYHSSPVNHSIPSAISIESGKATVTMKITEDFWHAGGAMHGSMYFKGLDDAAFFAANSEVDDAFVVTARFEVELLAMVSCTDVKAVGFLERREGRKLWARSELYDDAGALVARGKGLFVISSIQLETAIGYND